MAGLAGCGWASTWNLGSPIVDQGYVPTGVVFWFSFILLEPGCLFFCNAGL